jgi:hypothetical protein
MFRSLRMESVEARVLLSTAGADSDGLLDIAPEESQPAAIAYDLSGSAAVFDAVRFQLRALSGTEVVSSYSFEGGRSVDPTGQRSLKLETPSFARFVPEEVHNNSSQGPEDLVDITVVMSASQHPGSLEAGGPRAGFRRVVDRALIHRSEQSDHQLLAVDGQYAMLQAFELSGGDFDCVEENDASADRQSPRPRRDGPPPQPAARPAEGDVTRATSASHRQEEVPSEPAAKAADDSTRDDQRATLSTAPIDHSQHAEVFEQLGDNQASDLFEPAAYLNLGRKSGIAPAMIVAVGGQILLGASWHTRRRLSYEPAVERPLRQ